MKFTNAQLKDLETVEYFIPSILNKIKITDKDRKMYLEWSERGKHKNKIKTFNFIDGFNVLVSGKRWRGIHIHEMYEPAVLEGMGYCSFIDKTTPKNVVNFFKKEMFKGKDADLIENFYSNL